MAVGALNKIAGVTVEVHQAHYDSLVADREQLRILKNYTKLESVILKESVVDLIKAMEANNE